MGKLEAASSTPFLSQARGQGQDCGRRLVGTKVSSAWAFKLLVRGRGGEVGYGRLLLPSLQTQCPDVLDSMAAVPTPREPAGEHAEQRGETRARGRKPNGTG